jgi:hypothetical protein
VLDEIIAGPILRRLSPSQLVLWWVSPQPSRGQFQCYIDNQVVVDVALNSDGVSEFRVGKQAVIHLLDIEISLPADQFIEYDLLLETGGGTKTLQQIIPHLMFDGQNRPSFIITPQITNMLHGSCRNPHATCEDGLLAGEALLSKTLHTSKERPSLLMMSGDQIYADHVAAPTLHAIHQVIELLGLNDESFDSSGIKTGDELHHLADQYYHRHEFLPTTLLGAPWYKKDAEQDIFTSTYAHNHLISFAETMAMYFLVWSPTLWKKVSLSGYDVPVEFTKTHKIERDAIAQFIEGLPRVQRLLAHIPTYMIFDDHDVTDDWNLTALWEQAAYEHPFSKRIIGNMLMSYWLCQGWGNDPKQFTGDFLEKANEYNNLPNNKNHDSLVSEVLRFSKWQFHLDTYPKVVVLDSRTRRWRSEQDLGHPSGLMDWEAMCELQQELIGENAIILVSPAPIFGVKVIETIQRIATTCGKPLAVDAENWMAHPGSASTILNIFRHPKTPQHFVILSGDVHYSFVYDIELRFREHSPKIWQVTSSGIKNCFPEPLIGCLDHINRWLYGSYSPLNFFTKRRSMKVKGRNVINGGKRRLISKSGLGYLELNEDGSPSLICDLHNDGTTTEFVESNEEMMP